MLQKVSHILCIVQSPLGIRYFFSIRLCTARWWAESKVMAHVSILPSHGYILHTQARSRSYPTPSGIQKLAKPTVQYLNIQPA